MSHGESFPFRTLGTALASGSALLLASCGAEPSPVPEPSPVVSSAYDPSCGPREGRDAMIRFSLDLLAQNGVNEQASNVILGAAVYESGLEPNTENQIGGFGILAWSPPAKLQIEHNASLADQDATCLRPQINFVVDNARGINDEGLIGKMESAPSIGDASFIFTTEYLRPRYQDVSRTSEQTAMNAIAIRDTY